MMQASLLSRIVMVWLVLAPFFKVFTCSTVTDLTMSEARCAL